MSPFVAFKQVGCWLSLGLLLLGSSCSSSSVSNSAEAYRGRPARIHAGKAYAPPEAPDIVKRAVAAGNAIQNAPYQYGGGHGRPCWGLDCSGSVSYVLRSVGLMKGSTHSKMFKEYGEPGPGKWISIFARDGHVFMTIAGLRLDTSSSGRRDVGPRWTAKPRSAKGFKVRHPAGL
jgi:hypothetical protein